MSSRFVCKEKVVSVFQEYTIAQERERRGGIKKNGRDRREKERDLKNTNQLA